MKKLIALSIALLGAFAASAVGVEVLQTIDLARRNSSISWSFTEYCDTTVRLSVLKNGEDFDASGWETSLVLGGTSSGCVVEGASRGYGTIVYTVPACSMPTNGKYTVQFTAMRNGRSEEWARGTLRVNLNPGMEFMPTCWMGYQKVAKLAASMITVDLITNEVFQSVSSNLVTRGNYRIEPWTNRCVLIGKSFVPGLGRGYAFYWDRNETEPRLFKSELYPGFTFHLPGGSITNAYCNATVDGVTAVYTNDTTGTFYPADTNGVKKFNASLYWGNETAWKKAMGE